MKKQLAILVGIMIVHALAMAQTVDPFVGTWSAKFKTDEGIDREAELVIGPEGGTWKIYSRGGLTRLAPCLDRAFPATVHATSAAEVSVKVNASEAVPGCRNSGMVLKLLDGTHMAGTFGDGKPVSLERR
jgi:hypothetical protein